ncbi:M48 family metallopeptidase [Kordiimonas sp. SCSIO 12603]|uniref:M48 family metalloprotease n=1 Tax=Kordiimonas sp. SCSIO 12603 TaxID=2829596 RepID=UPI0021041DC4|nr:M48 family metalloprotease [Kordiimonas sp. SCSIO 12603]UTW57316.1 M48 family metallopeptidase [Kordiimonas sp. SCSIO 12603]
MRKLLKKIASTLVCAIALAHQAYAQSILRDAETEAFLHEISDPIFIAAGLDPRSVNIYLLSDPSLNAFVTGGQNIFIHSGLIMASDDVNQLLGVIAHETGHIAGGHLVGIRDAASTAGNFSILSLVLGAAAIAAGSPDAGIGLLAAGQTVAQRQFLAFNRVQESSADQAGAKYLNELGISGKGLIQFFDKLRDQEVLAYIRQDPYIRSHPLNRTRILSLEQVLGQSEYYNKPPNPKHNEQFNRLKAKLQGYIQRPSDTLKEYPLSDKTASARYARVYAYHKALEWDLALSEADALIEQEPANPYFHEIKGQILFENGKVREALPVFRQAVERAPRAPLVATALGQAMVSLEDDVLMAEAIPILENATRQDPGNTFAWFNLAKAYSWVGREADANLATAERFYSAGVVYQAVGYAKRAMDSFKTGSPEWLRAQDIFFIARDAAERQRKQQRRRRRFDVEFTGQQEFQKQQEQHWQYQP